MSTTNKVTITVQYLDQGTSQPPVILFPEEDYDLLVQRQEGEVKLVENTIAQLDVDLSIARSQDDNEDGIRRLEDERKAAVALRIEKLATIASTKSTKALVDGLRSQASETHFDITIPTFDEVMRVEHRYRTALENGTGYITDREAVALSLLRNSCPEALKAQPAIGRYVLGQFSKLIWAEVNQESFLLAWLSRS